MLTAAAMLAPDGRCKTLDAAADGYVRGEAVTALALSAREELAAPGGASVLAVVAGTAVNQDGRSSSLTAPHGPSQQAVVVAATAAAGLTPSELGAVEMHGTGTALGDPIEVGALAAIVRRPSGGLPTELAAAKSSYGHAETAAGAVGMLRAAQRLQGHARFAVLHLCALNPYVDSAMEGAGAGAFAAARQAAPGLLPAAGGMHAGVSAFAFQGTNAHAVLGSTAAAVEPGTALAAAAAAWQRCRFWYQPAPHHLLHRAAVEPGAGSAAFDVALGRPALAFLWEHQVSGGACR